jgi:hypothetical protein
MACTLLTHDHTIALTPISASDRGIILNRDQRQAAGTTTFAALFFAEWTAGNQTQ